jgi:hypothetical protein
MLISCTRPIKPIPFYHFHGMFYDKKNVEALSGEVE